MEQFIRQEWRADNIGEILEKARLADKAKTGRTLASLCKAIGINRSYWYQVKDGTIKTISMEHLQAIERELGVELYAIALTDKTITMEVINNEN